ncbi:diguanylate cyclase (GGDEF)-like protein/PAS domain S-box-containing protein [Amorphus suaedae]
MLSRSPILPTIETLQTILNGVPAPVFLIGRDHRLVMANDAFCDFARVTREEVLNTIGDLPEEQMAVFQKIDNQVFETGEPNENEEVVTDAAGAQHIVITRKRLLHLRTEDGEKPFIIASVSDVTRIREAEARARYLASHDTLTGISNRAEFNERLAEAIDLGRRTGGHVGLMLLDLDGFKTINDTHGHAAGDDVLRVVAQRLKSHVRVVDTIARLGGDEFCVVQAGAAQPGGPAALAQRLLHALEQPIVRGTDIFAVSASIGFAMFPEDGKDGEALFAQADAALYRVKGTGGHGFLGTGAGDRPGRGTPESTAADLSNDLPEALAGDQFSLTYAPLQGADGSIRAYEALATWNHPRRGAITFDELMPMAEQKGLIQEISAWMFDAACTTATTWDSNLRLCVNVSPVQFAYGSLAETVAAALEKSGFPGGRLELEIPETALVGDERDVGSVLGELKSLGARLALDHFGAGTSSIARLRAFAFDRLKIDESFIASLSTDPRSAAIVRAILHMGREMDIEITAEGVDGERQATMLGQMGFSELQKRL